MHTLFWTLLAAVAWCYAGYPLFIAAQARLRPRPLRPAADVPLPHVAVVLAVRNERAALEQRVANLLAQRYPADHLEVLVACNGSTDGTETLARELAARDTRVRIVISPAERGKAGALNAAVAGTDADVIAFADARQTFAPHTIAHLVAPFADAAVGVVTGRLLVQRAELASVEGVRLYWGLETQLRDAESRSGSVVGATGAVYAVRRRLFTPVPPNLILDDVYVPLRVAMGGHRVVMAPEALAFDVPARDQRVEYVRKRRTMAGNIQLVRALPGVLSPWRNPLFFRFLSHKLLRVLTPFCFVGLLVASAVLPGPAHLAFFVGELTLYLAGALGILVRVPALSIPSAFVLVHAAVFAAVWRWREDASKLWAQSSQVAHVTPGMLPDGPEPRDA